MELDKTITKIIPSIKDIFKSYFDNKENQEKLKFERNNDMHKELEWRKKVYNLEIQDTYTVKDLVILNSLINPYKKGNNDKDSLDFYINQVIINILQKLTNNNVNFDNKGDKRDNALKRVIGDNTILTGDNVKTLFDFQIDSGLLKKSLNPEQSAKVRECAHLLLKDDWKKQTK